MFSLCLVLLFIFLTPAQAFPNGPGSCASPNPLRQEGSSHVLSGYRGGKELSDFGLQVRIDGNILEPGIPFDFSLGFTHFLDLKATQETEFRGALLKIYKTGIDTSDVLTTNDPQAQVVELCTANNEAGIGHKSNVEKTRLYGYLRTLDVIEGLTLEVTAVIYNNQEASESRSEWYHSTYTLNSLSSIQIAVDPDAPGPVSPVTTTPVSIAPVSIAPVSTAPFSTAPLSTVPVAPVSTAPASTAPAAPVSAAPASNVPVAPVAAAPASTAPVLTQNSVAPFTSAPVTDTKTSAPLAQSPTDPVTLAPVSDWVWAPISLTETGAPVTSAPDGPSQGPIEVSMSKAPATAVSAFPTSSSGPSELLTRKNPTTSSSPSAEPSSSPFPSSMPSFVPSDLPSDLPSFEAGITPTSGMSTTTIMSRSVAIVALVVVATVQSL